MTGRTPARSGFNPANNTSPRARVNRLPSQGPGKGDGWGGPAKGASKSVRATAAALTPGLTTASKLVALTRKEEDAKIAAEMRAKLLSLARGAQREETQLTAATKLLERIEGQAVQRQINYQANEIGELTDDQIKTELARLGGAGTDPAAGTSAPTKPH